MSPAWKCSRPGWTGLQANWSSGRCPLPIAGGLELNDLQGPFQPKSFYDSMKPIATSRQEGKRGGQWGCEDDMRLILPPLTTHAL